MEMDIDTRVVRQEIRVSRDAKSIFWEENSKNLNSCGISDSFHETRSVARDKSITIREEYLLNTRVVGTLEQWGKRKGIRDMRRVFSGKKMARISILVAFLPHFSKREEREMREEYHETRRVFSGKKIARVLILVAFLTFFSLL